MINAFLTGFAIMAGVLTAQILFGGIATIINAHFEEN